MIDKDRNHLITRRTFLLGGVQGLLFSTVIGRMFHLEILSQQHYQKLADKNRLHSRLTLPQRGMVFDCQGKPLATNHNIYRAIMIRQEAEDWRASLSKVQKLLNLCDNTVENLETLIKGRPKFVPIPLKENLSWEDVSVLELHATDLSGIIIENGRNRFYPHPHETSHFLGYVASPSDKDLDGDPLLEIPGCKVGKAGLEKSLDVPLRGVPGITQVEVNAYRQVVRELSTNPAIPGKDHHLFINLDLQQTLYQRLAEEESGAAVVLDINTGGVLAYVSTPGFNGNLFVNGISHKDWQELSTHPRHALLNKPIAGQYAPGSTFKMIVALAALEKGLITPHTTVHCSGHIHAGSHKFHCWRWKDGGHGSVSLERAIATSCDIYFYHIGSLVGMEAICEMARRLGLGEKTGIEIPGEKKGLIPTKNWKSKVLGKGGWTLGETYNTSIGQGYVLATPLQLAVMTARLVSGTAIIPKLCQTAEHSPFASLEISSKNLSLIQNGMNRAANEGGGTSFRNRIQEPGFEMAGKTGTTQVRRITQKERDLGIVNSADRPWHHREHALFVGYAPIQAPRFAVSVLIEHGGSGGKVAAPVGRDVLWAAQQICKI